MSHSVLLAAGTLALVLLASCRRPSGGFCWSAEALDAGDVMLGGSATAEIGWSVASGQDVELLSVVPSCGCTGVRLEERGVVLGPGPVRAGTAGKARIQLRGTGSAGRAETAIDVLWRRGAEPDPSHSVLKVRFDRIQAFAVEPKEIARADASPQERIPFRITWRALRPEVALRAPGVRPDPCLDVTSFRETRSPQGELLLTAEGHVLPPSCDKVFQVASIELRGVDPEPPAVPVKLGYRAAVERTPVGMLVLTRLGDGTLSGRVSLKLSDVVKQSRIREVAIEPEELRSRFAASWNEVEPRTVAVTVTGRVAPSDSSVSGTICIRGEDPLFGVVVVRWMFLAPRRTS